MPDFYTIEDLGNLPEPKWMIEGLFEKDALVMLVGPPGSFKSFLAIDWALSLAAGRPWNGRVVEPSRVLYALGEGKASLLKRIQAWTYYKQLSYKEQQLLNANFRITFNVPQLASRKDAQHFTDLLQEDDFNPTLLIIDTLARSYVGKNENDPMDAGVWVESADRLRQMGMAVLVLHHTKKNTEFGLKYRGTTAFLGAMDTSFVLERNPEGFKGFAKLTCDKQKDHIEPPAIWMQSQHITPRQSVEGSIILVEIEDPEDQEKVQEQKQLIEDLMASLLVDNSYPSDRERGKALANRMQINENTAISRIYRARKQQEQNAK